MGQGIADMQGTSESFLRHLFAPRSLLLGMGLCLAAAGLAIYVSHVVRGVDFERQTLELVDVVRIDLDEELRQTRTWAERAAGRLTGTTSAAYLTSAYSLLWPDVRLSFYDDHGAPLASGEPASGGADARTSGEFALVSQALAGTNAAAFIEADGELRLSAAARSSHAQVRAVLVSHPISAEIIGRFKARHGADIAILSPGASENFSLVSSRAGLDVSARTLLQALNGTAGSVLADISVENSSIPAGIGILSSGRGAEEALLVVLPEEDKQAGSLAPVSLILILAGALCLFFLLSYAQYRWESRTSGDLALALRHFVRHGSLPAATPLPLSLRTTLRKLRTDLAAAQALASKAQEERDEALRSLNEGTPHPDRLDGGADQSFFQDAGAGFLLMRDDGGFLQVNASFATLLGYESPVHLLSEKTYLSDFLPVGEMADHLLAALREQPRCAQVVVLRRKTNETGTFTLMSLRPVLEDAEGRLTLACSLTDRELEEENARLRRECARTSQHNQALALLFAASCRQIQSLLFPSLLQGFPPEGNPPPERETGGAGKAGSAGRDSFLLQQAQMIRAHQFAFDDIFHIALAEAEHAPIVSVPLDLMQILEEVFLQILPVLHKQGTALFCEVDKRIDPRVRGAGLLLRHTLLRALFEVAGPMSGGRAFLGLAPAPTGMDHGFETRIQFTVAWYTSTEADAETQADAVGSVPGEAPAGAASSVPMPPQDLRDSRNQGGRQDEFFAGACHEILLFLMDKMGGELLVETFSPTSRSIVFLVAFGAGAAAEASFQGISFPLRENEGDFPSSAARASPAHISLSGRKRTAAPHPATGSGEAAFGPPGVSVPFASLAEDEASPPEVLTFPGMDTLGSPLNPLIPDYQVVPGDSGGEDSLNLLLVDADLQERLIFSSYLRGTAHCVTEAHDGLQGVDAFQNKDFDVIFMDMEMPLLNGYQAARVIRALEAEAGRRLTPIVAFAPQLLPDFKYQCMLAGCTDFLVKPFSQAALLALLRGFSQAGRASPQPARETF
ncbi:MAG: response regulator [Desulfovibrio sp.]|jgi:CheY-like chemotaxis protein/PAS domain-containing protein|nr:response regulator [Desulfovibrio sp.]